METGDGTGVESAINSGLDSIPESSGGPDTPLNGAKDPSGSATENTGQNDDSSVCRDFMRNVCTRGKKCKYAHPEGKNEAGGAAAALLQVNVKMLSFYFGQKYGFSVLKLHGNGVLSFMK